jgi:hypothetical protein
VSLVVSKQALERSVSANAVEFDAPLIPSFCRYIQAFICINVKACVTARMYVTGLENNSKQNGSTGGQAYLP